ncbi:hypothetical protein J6590_051357 [Homalodisca vitripennis]|nr:hypothetical protein J6590_051357 [Homalodisca vitripennis]
MYRRSLCKARNQLSEDCRRLTYPSTTVAVGALILFVLCERCTFESNPQNASPPFQIQCNSLVVHYHATEESYFSTRYALQETGLSQLLIGL